MSLSARIVIVGDEVLAGEVADANGPFLLATLARLGTRVSGLRMVPDEPVELAAALREGLRAADRVLVTGGIGPTHDDCTRAAVADALDRPLEPHAEALARLRAAIPRDLTPDDEAMALLPREAELLLSPEVGGFGFRAGSILVFPGVPHLLRSLLRANEAEFAGRPWIRREVITRHREGQVAAPLRALAAAWPQVRWGSYPRHGADGWELALVLRCEDRALADQAETALRALLVDLDENPV